MEQMEQYRNLLLENGFAEASLKPFRFWKQLTEKTAFIINLKERPQGTGVVYGVISTAVFWTEGDWDYFRKFGRSDDGCNLRFYLEIPGQADAAERISALYQEYLHIDKDTMLARVKELRKQFILQITNVLKPLGFRKKGNQWRKKLSDDIMLQFWADKDPYSDLYFFEVDIDSLVPPGGVWCYSKRLETKVTDIFDWKAYNASNCRFDWQLQSTEELLEIVERAYRDELKPFLDNSLEEMGKQPFVWKACICQRTRCANCWVEKNIWEAKA